MLVRPRVSVKNQIHEFLVLLGMEDARASLQSKRGSEELRTAFVQLVLGIRRSRLSVSERLMAQHESMKYVKGTGGSLLLRLRKRCRRLSGKCL